ncbi:hypothetical protein HV356_17420 [Citrobacter sp. RHBSTW-01065]|nr:hypothetical protein [Citrobacter sp. RHBSTW-01065]
MLADQPFRGYHIAIAVQSTLMQARVLARQMSPEPASIHPDDLRRMRERKFDMLGRGRGGSGMEHPHSSLRNPDNAMQPGLPTFRGWRTGFYDKRAMTRDHDGALQA